jgi:hypothetical protein
MIYFVEKNTTLSNTHSFDEWQLLRPCYGRIRMKQQGFGGSSQSWVGF